MKPKTKQSQEALNLLIDNHPDAMAISDLNGNILAINDKLAAIFGKTKEDLIGTSGYDHVETKVGAPRRKIIEQVIKTRKPRELIDKERGYWWKAIFQPIFDKEGNVVKLAYYIQDITEKKEAEDKYSDISKHLQLINDNITDMMLQVTLSGKITYVNPACERITGYKPKEVIGKRFTKFAPIRELPRYFSKIQEMKSGKKITSFETEVIHKNGNIIPVDFSGQMAIYDKKKYFHAVMRDISERKKTEIKLEKSEEKYRQLVDNIDEGLFLIDKTGKFTYANKTVIKRSGFSKKEFYKLNYLDIVSPKYHEIVKKKFGQLMKGGKIASFELEYITQKREKLFIEIKSQPVYKEKKIVGIQCLSIDITERKKVEQVLKESEQKFRGLAEQSPNMIFINKKGKIAYANQKSQEIMGYTYDEFFADDFNFLTLAAPESHDIAKTMFKKHSDGKDVPGYECILLTKDRSKLNVLIATKLIEYDGEPAILGIVTDITQMKKVEQEVQKGKEHLQNIVDSASEIIFTIGSDYKIKTWNKSARMITGYKQSHVVGKFIKNLKLFGNQDELKDYIQTIFKEKPATLGELTINTTFGIKKLFSVSPSYIRNESKNIDEILFVCRDITYEKERSGEILFGQSYRISETTSETAAEIFKGIIRTGHPGLYIGRTGNSRIKNIFTDVTPTIVKLSKEKDKNHLTCSNFEELLYTIEGFVSKEEQSIVLLDRIEYFIVNSSFESVIKNIYRLNDMISKHNCLLLLRTNPLLLDKTQMAILKEEIQEIPERQIDDVQLEETLFDILNYIQIENRRNALVSHSMIGKQFSISKVTTQRRIESLLEKGLIFSKKQGRIKTVYIAEKGKTLLSHRSTI